MSALKHSPAPWRVKGKKGSIWNENSWIASVWDTDREANQALIIAAPDLLRALKCFVADERFVVGVGGNPLVVEKMIEDAKTAIARAEGHAP